MDNYLSVTSQRTTGIAQLYIDLVKPRWNKIHIDIRTAEDYASDMFGQATNDNEVEPDNLPLLMEVSDDEDDDEDDDNEEELEMAAMVAELEKN